jgi:hypothetical protein
MVTKFYNIKYSFFLCALLLIFTACSNLGDKASESEAISNRQGEGAVKRPLFINNQLK